MRKAILLTGIFLAAFLIRFLSHQILVGGLNDPPIAKTDAVEYDVLARSLADGNGFRYGADHPPTAFRPPLYPCFLAGAYLLFGKNYWMVRILQFSLSSLAAVLVWPLAQILTKNSRIALIASLIAAIHPSMVYHSGFLLTESLYSFFMVLACLSLAYLQKNPSVKHMTISGLTLALLCALRPNAIFFPALLCFWFFLVFKPFSKAVRIYLSVIAVFLLCLSPWMLRNYSQFGRPVFISTNGGMNFWGANNPLMLTDEAAKYGAWKGGIIYDVSYLPGSEDLQTQWIEKEFDQFELDRRSWKLALDYLRHHPDAIPLLVWNKLKRFWSVQIRSNALERMAFILLDQGMALLALAGMILFLRSRDANLSLLLFSFLSVHISALIFFADTRMRVGIGPAIAFYAALALDRIKWFSAKRRECASAQNEKLSSYRREPDWIRESGEGPRRISLVIPAYNVRKSLEKTLLSLAQQTYPSENFEVLVIDNGSTEDILSMLKETSLPFRIKYYYQERTGRQVGKCRNIGIANAEGELIIFVDADCMCSSNLIEKHAAIHRKHEKTLAMGEIRMMDPNDCLDKTVKISLDTLRRGKMPTQTTLKGRVRLHFFYWWEDLLCGFSSKLTYWMSGANSSAKRSHLLAVGGYDEDFDMNWGDEDAELGYRLEKIGLKPIYVHAALIFHQWHETSKSGIPGHNRILFLLKHPELTRTRRLMRSRNKYFGKTKQELERMLENAIEETRNYYQKLA